MHDTSFGQICSTISTVRACKNVNVPCRVPGNVRCNLAWMHLVLHIDSTLYIYQYNNYAQFMYSSTLVWQTSSTPMPLCPNQRPCRCAPTNAQAAVPQPTPRPPAQLSLADPMGQACRQAVARRILAIPGYKSPGRIWPIEPGSAYPASCWPPTHPPLSQALAIMGREGAS